MIFPRRITLQLGRIYTRKLLLCHFEENINKSVLVARPLSCVPNSLLDIDVYSILMPTRYWYANSVCPTVCPSFVLYPPRSVRFTGLLLTYSVCPVHCVQRMRTNDTRRKDEDGTEKLTM